MIWLWPRICITTRAGTPWMRSSVAAVCRAYAELVRAGRGNEDARLALLQAHRDAVLEQVDEVKRNLASIEKKIESYQVRARSIERDLADA